MENIENKNKSGFLITCGACIVILLTLCFFGVNDSLKGTRSVSLVCPDGYPYDDGDKCYYETDAVKKVSAGGSCSCKGATIGVGNCNCGDSGGRYVAGTCSGNSCNCPAGYSVSNNSCSTTVETYGGTCISSGSSAYCGCAGGTVTSNNCKIIESYSCQTGVVYGDKCRVYADKIEDDKETPVYTCDGGETTQSDKICEEKEVQFDSSVENMSCNSYLGSGWSGSCSRTIGGLNNPNATYRYTCDCTKTATLVSGSDSGTGSLENCERHPGEGWSCGYFNVAGESGKVCYTDCLCVDTSKCGEDDPYDNDYYDEWGGMDSVVDGDIVYNCPLGTKYDPTKGTCIGSWDDTNDCDFSGSYSPNGEPWNCSSSSVTDGLGNTTFTCSCVPVNTTNCDEDCDCTTSDELVSAGYQCYYDSITGKYYYGAFSGGNYFAQKDDSNCKIAPSDPSGPTTNPGTPSGGGTPDDDPDDGDNNQPSNNPGGDNPDDDPASSNPIYTPDDNITENPQTGQIAIFVVWVLAFGAIIYSVWYFRKVRES